MNFMCLLSALCFIVGNAVTIAYYVVEYRRPHFNYNEYIDLDPAYIQEEWAFRNSVRPMYTSAGVINTFAWFFLMFPLVQLAWILSQGGTKWISVNVSIAILVVTGSLTEWISHVLYIGSSMTSALLTEEFNLNNWITTDENNPDELGWRTLEVTHIVTFGLVSIIGAIEWLFMGIIMMLIHVSIRRWQREVDLSTFGSGFNAFGLFISLMCILEFATEILRLIGFKYASQIAFWYSSVNRIILLPTWLLILGCKLSYASLKLNQQAHMREQQEQQAP
mmetsp:Transcript_18911/g.38923  ORF Transcript_18911/g.38923 Transcript_18911/m.38923 type:complete len:278 (+) Transcript_18911:76-909(+)|eukprot:CAMPEP_0197263784 /NCGR_PEP_ID=MMETSP1432-20130617/1383_1 /TAXON_ID=44447 /ORGANISM="Pseudo-nitzschia delicatissima, Strain UNC1205" /LENGTH=277 /DNA_ID=CAMNT_0042728333 /DNA_START=74 /DNA_END=907 /DNA_ORIENTATION=-